MTRNNPKKHGIWTWSRAALALCAFCCYCYCYFDCCWISPCAAITSDPTTTHPATHQSSASLSAVESTPIVFTSDSSSGHIRSSRQRLKDLSAAAAAASAHTNIKPPDTNLDKNATHVTNSSSPSSASTDDTPTAAVTSSLHSVSLKLPCSYHRSSSSDISSDEHNRLWWGKVILVPLVFVSTLGASILPWFLSRLDKAVAWLGFGACLAAGVILGAGFEHILVDARHAWEKYFCLTGGHGLRDPEADVSYPFAEMIACATVLCLITVDSAIIRGGITNEHDTSSHAAGAHGHGHNDEEENGGSHAGHSHAVPTLPKQYWDELKKKEKEKEKAKQKEAGGQDKTPDSTQRASPSSSPSPPPSSSPPRRDSRDVDRRKRERVSELKQTPSPSLIGRASPARQPLVTEPDDEHTENAKRLLASTATDVLTASDAAFSSSSISSSIPASAFSSANVQTSSSSSTTTSEKPGGMVEVCETSSDVLVASGSVPTSAVMSAPTMLATSSSSSSSSTDSAPSSGHASAVSSTTSTPLLCSCPPSTHAVMPSAVASGGNVKLSTLNVNVVSIVHTRTSTIAPAGSAGLAGRRGRRRSRKSSAAGAQQQQPTQNHSISTVKTTASVVSVCPSDADGNNVAGQQPNVMELAPQAPLSPSLRSANERSLLTTPSSRRNQSSGGVGMNGYGSLDKRSTHTLAAAEATDEKLPLLAESPLGQSKQYQQEDEEHDHHHDHAHHRHHRHHHSHEEEEHEEVDDEPSDTAPPDALESMRGTRRAVSQAYVFFFALALHSIFDGLSIGGETTMQGYWAMLFAVASHKILDGFALGTPVYFARLPKFHTIFALVFCALMTPMGIVVGMWATNNIESRGGLLSKAIILSLSTGSFIFISLVELLPAGLMDGQHLLAKMGVCAIGFACMAIVAIWV